MKIYVNCLILCVKHDILIIRIEKSKTADIVSGQEETRENPKNRVKKGTAKQNLAQKGKSLPENIVTEKSSDTLHRFEGAIRAFSFGNNCGNSSGEKSNVCDSVQISFGIDAMYPEAFLTGRFKAGVIAFRLGTKRINFLERNTFTVNGKSVIIRNSNIFRAVASLFVIIPVFMIAGTTA